jgi:hypothetical protein
MIYVAHPYNNDPKNKIKVEHLILKLQAKYPTLTFVSPIHTFGFMYEILSYEQGMDKCLNLLRACDTIILAEAWEQSVGCGIEKAHARMHGKMITYEREWI